MLRRELTVRVANCVSPITDVTDNSASLPCNSVPTTGQPVKTRQPTLGCPGKSAMFNFYKQRQRFANLYPSSFSSSIDLFPSSSSDSESTSTSVSDLSRGASGVTLLSEVRRPVHPS